MPRNIEIKARLAGPAASSAAEPHAEDPPAALAALLPRARALAASDAVLIEQDDQFYPVPNGRLKLRRFADGSAELIHYTRADDTAAKASDYVRVVLADRSTAIVLDQALQRALGVAGDDVRDRAASRVRKRRWLLLRDDAAGFHTRIHLDEVAGLGSFIELEVVLQAGQTDTEGQAVAEALMAALGLADAPRVAGAYADLLVAAQAASSS